VAAAAIYAMDLQCRGVADRLTPPMREIHYKLTSDDLVKAFRAHRRSSGLYFLLYFPPLGLVFLAMGIIALAMHWRLAEIPLVMGLFWLVGIPYLTNAHIFRALASHSKTNHTISVEATRYGLQIYARHADWHDKWSDFIAYLETPDLFLLYLDRRLYRPIPKRAFKTAAEVDEFRRLLVENIGTIRNRRRL
jgi:hypothetical protein